MTDQAPNAVTDVAPTISDAEPTPPWVASTEAVVVELPSATRQVEPEQEAAGQEQPQAPPADDVVTLKRDEYRRLMGTVGGLSSLQQQFQGIKAENAELRKQLQEWQQFRQQMTAQEQQSAMQGAVQQLLAQAKERITGQLSLTEAEFDQTIAPILQPVLQRALEVEQQRQQLEQAYTQAREQQARLAGAQWLQQASAVVIDEVVKEFAAIGVQATLSPQDLVAVGATVETVRDIDHLRLLAREAVFRKLQGAREAQAATPNAAAPSAPSQATSPNSLAAATGLPAGPWGLTPSGPSAGALSPRSLRQQYAAGQITLEQFREGMAKASKEEKALVPSLFR